MKERIYLDHAATTPVLKEALDAMAPWVGEKFGNPSSLYAEGREARRAIDEAREAVASAFGCLFGEVVFTSSGTESCNLAIVGSALAHRGGRDKVLFSAAEHHCVLNTRPLLERLGYKVETVPVDHCGCMDIQALERQMDDRVLLVSAMHANNETGALNDVPAVGDIARKFGALFHCDAVQTFPWVRDTRPDADLVSVSAHKFGGPKGTGALCVKAGTPLSPLTVGGGQEREVRAGTENVAGIVGMAAAVSATLSDQERNIKKAAVKSTLKAAIAETGFIETVCPGGGLTGHLHGRFPGVPSESLLIRLDQAGVSASAGSACSSGSIEPSHVLLAAGWGEAANEAVRFTFGAQTTMDEATEAARRTIEAVRDIRSSQSRN